MSLERKREAIERLKKSESFPKNELNFQLLDYLAKIGDDENVKSSVIALEVLGEQKVLKNSNQDSYIRNKLHSLRKSLELYYHKEGKEDTLQLQIPNRYYKLVLVEKKQTTFLFTKEAIATSFFAKASTAYILLAVCVFFMLLYLFTSSNDTSKVEQNNFITSLLEADREVDIVVGDMQLYSEHDKDFNRVKYVYDKELYYQDPKSLSRYIKKNLPHRKIKTKTEFFHVSTEAMLMASKLQLDYGLQGIKTEIRRSSSILSVQRPTVFLSKCKSSQLYKLSSLFKSERFVCNTYGKENWISSITHFKVASDSSLVEIKKTLLRRVNKKAINRDYIIIKKVQTIHDMPLLFVLPGDEFSRLFIINKLQDADFYNYLMNSFEEGVPDEFEMLMKIEGEDIMGCRYEIAVSYTHLTLPTIA